MSSQQMDKTINEMRSWLDENRDNYNEAIEKMSDPAFVKTTLASIRSWMLDVMGYNPTKHSSDVAVFVVGRAQVFFHTLLNDLDFVAQFEEEQQRFNDAVREIEAEEKS